MGQKYEAPDKQVEEGEYKPGLQRLTTLFDAFQHS